MPSPTAPIRRILLAFAAIVLLGGANSVAVRVSNLGLPPFWGAALRFLVAGALFWAIVWWRRVPLPRGRALAGALIYGTLTIGLYYALLYWGLVYVTAGLTTVLLSLVPLLTFFAAVLHRQEAFTWRSLLGGLVAFAGILLAIGGQLRGAAPPMLPLLALMAAGLVLAEGTVIYKSFPHADPLAANAVCLSIGAPILLLISRLAGEPWALPAAPATWAAFAYLVLGGSLLLFYLYLYVLHVWTASATAYSFLLFPIAAVLLGYFLLGEPLTGRFVLGAIVVLLGVYFGAVKSADPV